MSAIITQISNRFHRFYLRQQSKWLESDERRTLVVPYTAEQVMQALAKNVKPLGEKRNKEDWQRYKFNGFMSKSHFKLTRMIREPNNFIAILKGEVLGCGQAGCIVQVSYSMFAVTRFLLFFFSLLGLFMSAVLLFWKGSATYASITLGVTILHYIVCVANYRRQKTLAFENLEQIIEEMDRSQNVY
ncbi:MAG: hypothetical protein JJT94_14300 [Bernardetiaceae bacterium]|nr:hypothetical protein [Bernardetiaceae bacterium]